MRYTEENPPICKCGRAMKLYQEPLLIPAFFWACSRRHIFNFWKHTARFMSGYGYQ